MGPRHGTGDDPRIPRGLLLAWWGGALLATLGLVAAAVASIRADSFLRGWNGGGSTVLRCGEQLENRSSRLRELDHQLRQSKVREQHFADVLSQPTQPGFASAREELERESAHQKTIARERQGLVITPAARMIPMGAMTLVFVVLFSRWVSSSIVQSTRRALRIDGPVVTSWRAPFFIVVVLLFVAHCAEQAATSVFDTDKVWFYWASFCVLPSGFYWLKLTFLGTYMVVAVPATIVYCLSRRRFAPVEVELQHPDGRCGVGDYISLLQRWCFVGVLGGILPILAALRVTTSSHDDYNIAYAFTPAVAASGMLYLILRLIRNAHLVRRAYFTAREKLGDTWADVQAAVVPDDPTVLFLGTEWWKLPAVVTAVLTVALTLAEFLGISAAILK